jgi:hypothetical protein
MALIESVSETIAQLLSPQVVEGIFARLEKTYSVKRAEIPSRLDMLLLTLETIFGSRGSGVIGKAIARRFYSMLGLEFSDDPQGTLITYVENAKRAQPK